MINATILSLNVISLISSSPFYTIHQSHQIIPRTTILNSHFTRSFTSYIVSYTNRHQTIIHHSEFSYALQSAILLTKEISPQCKLYENKSFEPNTQIKNEMIDGSQFSSDFNRPIFKYNCGNITITGCEFHHCYSENEGGSLHIQQECQVMIHNTIFANSSTKS